MHLLRQFSKLRFYLKKIFFSFQYRMSKNITSNKYYGQCHSIQNPEHLIINCHHFWDQQLGLIKKMKSQPKSIICKTLFTTNDGLKHLVDFLKLTNIATRKWSLGEINSSDDFGWGSLQN